MQYRVQLWMRVPKGSYQARMNATDVLWSRETQFKFILTTISLVFTNKKV